MSLNLSMIYPRIPTIERIMSYEMDGQLEAKLPLDNFLVGLPE